MWAGSLPFTVMKDRGRWKVEFFSGDSLSKSDSVFESTPLGDVLIERKEMLDPQQFPEHRFNYIGLENITSHTGDLVDFQPRPGTEIRSRSKVFRQGDVLYGRLRPNLNKVYLVDQITKEGICSGEFYVLTPNAKTILPNFARTILASKYVQELVVGLLTGSALPRLQLDDLLEIEIPLPPLKQQVEFENLIIEETLYRRRLTAELADAPLRLLNAVVTGLESGSLPKTGGRDSDLNDAITFDNSLPVIEPRTRRKGEKGQNGFDFLSH